jgi:hypothetical protein
MPGALNEGEKLALGAAGLMAAVGGAAVFGPALAGMAAVDLALGGAAAAGLMGVAAGDHMSRSERAQASRNRESLDYSTSKIEADIALAQTAAEAAKEENEKLFTMNKEALRRKVSNLMGSDGTDRLKEGDQVCLAPDGNRDNCLDHSKIGVVIEDDGSDVPFKVECEGVTAWYKESDLQIYEADTEDNEDSFGAPLSAAIKEDTRAGYIRVLRKLSKCKIALMNFSGTRSFPKGFVDWICSASKGELQAMLVQCDAQKLFGKQVTIEGTGDDQLFSFVGKTGRVESIDPEACTFKVAVDSTVRELKAENVKVLMTHVDLVDTILKSVQEQEDDDDLSDLDLCHGCGHELCVENEDECSDCRVPYSVENLEGNGPPVMISEHTCGQATPREAKAWIMNAQVVTNAYAYRSVRKAKEAAKRFYGGWVMFVSDPAYDPPWREEHYQATSLSSFGDAFGMGGKGRARKYGQAFLTWLEERHERQDQ